MRYPTLLVEATIWNRRKRFLADVELPGGECVVAHLANTGRMTGCWTPGGRCRVLPNDDPRRKLRWSVEQTCVDGRWILVNTARANRLVEEAIRDGRIPALRTRAIRREAPFPEGGRADLLLDGTTWVEVKHVTLLRGEVLAFPDAVSVRAVEHLRKLRTAVSRGERAVLFLHVGHEGGRVVQPATWIDPHWAGALRDAHGSGVEIMAWRARYDRATASLDGPLPFRFDDTAPITTPAR